MALLVAEPGTPAMAQQCKPDDVFAVIDETGARLREINAETEPRLKAKLRDLAGRRGWAETEMETRARPIIEDAETQRLDGRAAELLSDIDRLGDDSRTALAPCERLDQVRTKSKQIAEVTAQRASHVIARIDIAMLPAAAAPQQTAPPPPAPAPAAPAARQTPAPTAKAAPQPSPAWQTMVRDAEPAKDPAASAPFSQIPPRSASHRPRSERRDKDSSVRSRPGSPA